MIRLGPRIKSPARCVAYSPDGKVVATGGEDRAVSLWEWPSGRLVERLTEHPASVYAVTFRPDGQVLASGGGQSDLRLWALPGGQRLASPSWAAGGHVACLSFDPVRPLLAASSRRSMGGGWIAPGVAAYWATDGEPVWQPLDVEHVYALALSPVGDQYAVSVIADGGSPKANNQVHLRPWSAGPSVSLPHRTTVSSLAFSAQGDWLAAAAGREVYLWVLSARDAPAILKGHERAVRSVAFSPAGDLLASGGLDGKVILWDVVQCSTQVSFDLEVGAVYGLAFAPDGMTLAVAGEEGIVVFDVDVG
jgi:WD40 repeat protein